MFSWIYNHFINTLWFLLIMMSIPGAFGLYLIYSQIKQNRQDNDDSQNQ
ncbi:hypothetical protein KW850_02120 [Bacillus sp. sid0103]|nr:hypothetical protein [Bacillus sp. sid0103]